jgi:hypothetical protein
MGEPDQTDPDGPGVSGFAARFAASSRRTEEREKPGIARRLTAIGAAVVIVVAGALGVGMLVSYQHKSSKTQAASLTAKASTVPQGGTTSTSPSPVGRTSSSAKPSGPVLPAPLPANTPAVDHRQAAPPAAPAGTGGSTPSAGNAPQPVQQNVTSAPLPTRSIVSYASSRCIDVTNGSRASGTQLQIWDCSGDAWQQWSFPSDGTVRSMGMCMAVSGGSTADGAPIVLEPCNGSAAEKFTLNGSYDLVNSQANKCVDVTNQQTANGTRLQLWSCAGTSNQKWHLA